jgi:hypothetical protein
VTAQKGDRAGLTEWLTCGEGLEREASQGLFLLLS